MRARRSPEGRVTAGASKGPHAAGSPSARHLRTERERVMTRNAPARRSRLPLTARSNQRPPGAGSRIAPRAC